MSSAAEEVSFDVDGRLVAGLRRRPAGTAPGERDDEAPRLLCLHGWLDNAASFVPLMAYLPNADIVALDLPGHGASDWLEAGYSFAETVYRVRRVMQRLGWDRCHVAGHSLGGCLAPQLAVAAPEAVGSLLLIEASGPLSEEADALPARLRRALEERLDITRFASRTFPDPDAAVAARLRAARMAPESARLIVERQIHERDGGWQWRFDPRLRVASSAYLTEAQVRAVLAAVTCPALTVIATEGFLAGREDTEARLGVLRSRTSVTLAGNHHLHMDTPGPVGEAMKRFLGC